MTSYPICETRLRLACRRLAVLSRSLRGLAVPRRPTCRGFPRLLEGEEPNLSMNLEEAAAGGSAQSLNSFLNELSVSTLDAALVGVPDRFRPAFQGPPVRHAARSVGTKIVSRGTAIRAVTVQPLCVDGLQTSRAQCPCPPARRPPCQPPPSLCRSSRRSNGRHARGWRTSLHHCSRGGRLEDPLRDHVGPAEVW
jgi:hypothetical protein